ncbi:hypothetical protein [Lysinibacillus sp. ZYM-1]|uniref:hypothetical protein n=1 Tax=Lysinibacillus sp. ZYM-1 TaxID=1681184 RepID=UPI0006CE967E|nr:hypothetical protein [Lysinibacillus sp. ZYM-1]KPN95288.1 hypothetical protein AO843_03660 [Lysinibacillus sp. ZYM-1]
MNDKETTAILELVIYKDSDISLELMNNFYGSISNVILNDEGGNALTCECMDSSLSSLILMDKWNDDEVELIKGIGDTKFIYKKSQEIDIHYDSLVQLDDHKDNIYCVVEFQNIVYLYNGYQRKSIIENNITCLKSLKDYLNRNYPKHKILERMN